MKVWIVNPYDNLPSEGYRPQRFWLMARAFARAGCETTLWTSAFSHAHKRPRALKGELSGEGFEVRLVKTPGYRANIGFGRIVDHWLLARRWLKGAEREERPDLIVASSPPLSLVSAVRKFARRRGVPYVVDVMDAWPETFERVLPRFALRALGLYRRARQNYLGASRISAVADRYVQLVRGYGYTGEVRKFLHGIERTACPAEPDRRAARSLRLVYVGNMSLSYDLESLIRAVQTMQDVTLDLAGKGPDLERLESVAGKGNGDSDKRIRFRGYLGERDLNALLAECDAGVIPMFTASCVGVPYKLADYAAAGLPVLNSLEGETAELLSRYGAGFSYRAGDVASLCQAIERLKASDRVALGRGSVRLSELLDARKIYDDYVLWACR